MGALALALRGPRAHWVPRSMVALASAMLVGGTVLATELAAPLDTDRAVVLPLWVVAGLAVSLLGRDLGLAGQESLGLMHVRGARRSARWLWAAGPTVLPVIAGAAIGIVAGQAGAPGSARLLSVGDRASISWPWVAVAVVLCLLLAVVGAVLGATHRPRDEVTGRAVGRRAGLLGTVLRIVVWLLTALTVWHLITTADDTPGWEAWLAPAVWGLAFADLLLMLRRPVSRVLRTALPSEGLETWLTTRVWGRRRSWDPITRLLVATAVVAGFSATAVVATEQYADERARVDVGAAHRYAFDGGAMAALDLTERLDPAGRYLAAGALLPATSNPEDPGGTLYLDAQRAPRAVGDTLDGTPAGDVPDRMDALTDPQLLIRGRTLVAEHDLRAGGRGSVRVTYLDPDDVKATVTLPLRGAPGIRQDVTVKRTVPCEKGCSLISAEIRGSAGPKVPPTVGDGVVIVSMRLGSLRSLTLDGAELIAPGGWVDPDSDSFDDQRGWDLRQRRLLLPAAAAQPLSIISATERFTPTITTLAGIEHPVGAREEVPALPLLGTSGLLMDLRAALMDGGPVPDQQIFVLAAEDTPAAILDDLAKETSSAVSVDQVHDGLAGRAPLLAGLLAGLAVVAAMTAAIGCLPRLRAESRSTQRALASLGVTTATRNRALRRESWLRAGLGAVCTLAGTVVLVRLWLPELPLDWSDQLVGHADLSVRRLPVLTVALVTGLALLLLQRRADGRTVDRDHPREAGLLGTLRRGLVHRWMLSTGVLMLLALAVGSAILGPCFSDAAVRSYLTTRLADSPAVETSLLWTFTPNGSGAPTSALERVRATLQDRIGTPFGAPEMTLSAPLRGGPGSQAGGELPATFPLLARDGACEHVQLTGRCPQRPGEVVMTDADLDALGLEESDTVRLRDDVELTIVGSYASPAATDDSFWVQPAALAPVAEYRDRNDILQPRRAGAVITVPATFDSVPGDRWLLEATSRQRPDPRDPVRDIEVAASLAARYQEAAPAVEGGELALNEVSLNLRVIADDVADQQSVARTAVAPAVLSLVLVALALLLRLLSAAGDLRRPELALASLRGSPKATLWRLALAEPLILVVIALPVGVAIGYGLTWMMSRAWLTSDLPVRIPGSAYLFVALVLVAAVAVAASTLRRLLQAPLSEQLSGVGRPRVSSALALLGFLGLAAVAFGLVLTRVLDRDAQPRSTDLLIPITLAVVAGLAVTWLLIVAANALSRSRRADRTLTAFVLTRSVGRRRENSLLVLPLVAALAITALGIGVFGASAQWRQSVATSNAPADQVWTSPQNGADTLALTERADPDGRWTMAAVRVTAPATNDGPAFRGTLIDSTRLPTVGRWWSQWTDEDVEQVRDELGGVVPPRMEAGSVGATVDNGTGGPIYAVYRYAPIGGKARSVQVGPFPDGRERTRDVRLRGCADGCSLIDLQLGGKAGLGVTLAGGAAVTPRLGGRPWDDLIDASVSTPGVAGSSSPVKSLDAEGDTWSVRLDTGGGTGTGLLRFVASSERVPVVLGERAGYQVDHGSDGDTVLYSVHSIPVDTQGEALSIPLGGPRDLLMDLRQFIANPAVSRGEGDSYILLRDDTPPAVLDQLREAGAQPLTTNSAERRLQDSSAFAQALRLYLVVAALVLAMSLIAMVITTAVQLPSRRRDAASLRVVGVPRRVLTTALVGEQAILLAVTVLTGLLAGIVAATLLTGTLTLGARDDPDLPRVLTDLAPVPLLLLGASTFLVLLSVSALAGARTVQAARGSTLRESAR